MVCQEEKATKQLTLIDATTFIKIIRSCFHGSIMFLCMTGSLSYCGKVSDNAAWRRGQPKGLKTPFIRLDPTQGGWGFGGGTPRHFTHPHNTFLSPNTTPLNNNSQENATAQLPMYSTRTHTRQVGGHKVQTP